MPNRILREGILTSERVNALAWPAEVFYRRLMSAVDDFGRYWGKSELLRAGLYPLLLDRVGNPDVVKWLTECVNAGLVRKYTVEEKEYLQLLDFRQQVRAARSKFPEPSSASLAVAKRLRSKGTADAPVVVVGDVIEDEKREVAVLPEWLPKEEWKALLEVRKGKKVVNTPRALKLLITELERLKSVGHDPAKVLDQSTVKSWSFVYPLKPELVALVAEPKGKLCDYCTKVSTGAVNGRRACDGHWAQAMGNEVPAKIAA